MLRQEPLSILLDLGSKPLVMPRAFLIVDGLDGSDELVGPNDPLLDFTFSEAVIEHSFWVCEHYKTAIQIVKVPIQQQVQS